MGLTVLRKKSYYALGAALAIFGFMMLLIVVWKWWDTGVFSNPGNMVSAITESFGAELLGLGLGITLLHGTIIGVGCTPWGDVLKTPEIKGKITNREV